MEQFNKVINDTLQPITQNSIVMAIITLFVLMVVVNARPNLPPFLVNLYNNVIFRAIILSYALYQANRDPYVAIMITFAFLFIMNQINRQYVDKFAAVTTFNMASNQYKNEKKYFDDDYARLS